jgi:hypothetical protein
MQRTVISLVSSAYPSRFSSSFLLVPQYNFVYESCNDRATKTLSPPPSHPSVVSIYYIRPCNMFFFAVSLRESSGGDGKWKCVFHLSVIRPRGLADVAKLFSHVHIYYISIIHTRRPSYVFARALKRGLQCSHYTLYLHTYIAYIYTRIHTS